LIVIGSIAGDSELQTAENRDSAAAAVQNFMLAATSRGLATYWGSCPKGANDPVAKFCGFESDTKVVSIMYLGWATTQVETPQRPAANITFLEK
jgi:nitroreductase